MSCDRCKGELAGLHELRRTQATEIKRLRELLREALGGLESFCRHDVPQPMIIRRITEALRENGEG